MTHILSDELYRKALEAEGGEPVSAGARVAHVRAAVQAGQSFNIDLSTVPPELRASVIDHIHKFIASVSRVGQGNRQDTVTSN
jgi:hypothetical protein